MPLVPPAEYFRGGRITSNRGPYYVQIIVTTSIGATDLPPQKRVQLWC